MESSSTSRDTRDTDGTLTHEGRASFSSSTSGKEGRSLSDMAKRSVKTRQSGWFCANSLVYLDLSLYFQVFLSLVADRNILERGYHHDDVSGTNMSSSQHLSSGAGSRQNQDQVPFFCYSSPFYFLYFFQLNSLLSN